MKEYNIILTSEQRKQMNGGGILTIQLDDDAVLNLSKEVKRQSAEAYRKYNKTYYEKNKDKINAIRRERRAKGELSCYNNPEYQHKYYLNVTKPKRKKERERGKYV